MKGILLAGGRGTRLYPITFSISKQLLPVYDKPMIYYPLTTLMQFGIRDIAIITTKDHKEDYFRLLNDGKQIGINFTYLIQEKPRGIAEAFIISKQFIDNDNVCLILGDNVFYNLNYSKIKKEINNISGAIIFALYHNNPSQYGVVEYSDDNVISIEEKPQNPKSNYIIPGLYFYDNTVIKIAENLKPSLRGELEISDLNKEYLFKEQLRAIQLGHEVKWFDAGNPKNLFKTSMFIKREQSNKGKHIACLEEISYQCGYIDKQQIVKQIKKYQNSEYGKYLNNIAYET